MTLEELVGKDIFEAMKDSKFRIDPNSKYDRREFVKRAGDLFDLQEYHNKLKQNVHDSDALKDALKVLSRYMPNDKDAKNRIMAALQENPNLALDMANVYAGFGEDAMVKFVKNKRNSLLDKLSGEQLFQLFEGIPLYKTGNKEYDRAKDLRDKILLMKQAQKEGGKLENIVQDEVNDYFDSLSDELKFFIQRNSSKMYPVLVESVINGIGKSYASLFRTEEGYDRGAIIDYLKANYKVAENFIKDVPDEEKADYWNDNLKPQYLAIAKQLYASEKKAQKQEDNPEKQKRIKQAKELGLFT